MIVGVKLLLINALYNKYMYMSSTNWHEFLLPKFSRSKYSISIEKLVCLHSFQSRFKQTKVKQVYKVNKFII